MRMLQAHAKMRPRTPSPWGQEDDVPVLALVELYGAELVDPGGPQGGGLGANGASPAPAPRRLRARMARVHDGLHSRRPGLRILQASWHPASPGHFAALASDGVWRLYSTADVSEPEQSFSLRLPGAAPGGALGLAAAASASSRGLGLGGGGGGGAGGGGAGAPPRPAAFAWGPGGGGGGWGQLSVLFLATDGGVYALCPVAPFGMRVAAGALRRLVASCGGGDEDGGGGGAGLAGGTARAWLQAAFPGVVHPAGDVLAPGEGFTVRPHLLEAWCPALQGPLNAGSESAAAGRRAGGPRGAAIGVAARSAAAGARRLFVGGSNGGDDGLGGGGDEFALDDEGPGASGGGGGGGAVTCAAVLTAFDDGRLYSHALDAGALLPAWAEGLPQCAYDSRMDVVGVRCECEAVPVAGAEGAGTGGGGGDGGPAGEREGAVGGAQLGDGRGGLMLAWGFACGRAAVLQTHVRGAGPSSGATLRP
jgi:hypothetical protein